MLVDSPMALMRMARSEGWSVALYPASSTATPSLGAKQSHQRPTARANLLSMSSSARMALSA